MFRYYENIFYMRNIFYNIFYMIKIVNNCSIKKQLFFFSNKDSISFNWDQSSEVINYYFFNYIKKHL